jgi:hypothetical protein
MLMSQRTIFIIVSIVVIFIVFIVLLLLRGTQRRSSEPQQLEEVVETVEVNNILDDPLAFDNLNVKVEAGITDWITKRAFTVAASGGALGSAGELLVIRKEPFSLPENTAGTGVGLGEEITVRIEGRVRILDREQLERELGLDLDGEDIQLDDNDISNWSRGSVLLADRVERLEP